MSRYIDADKIEEVIRNDVSFKYLMASNYSEAIINRFKIAEILNDKIPTADVKEVKHGQWNTVLDESILEHYNNDVDTFACSICGIKSKRPTNFCPFCGARMDGGRHRSVVYFKNGKFAVNGSNYNFKDICPKNMEVIGNIYDNPELLKG